MKYKILSAAIISASLILSGCDVELNTTIDLDKLKKSETSYVEVASLVVDVPSCKDRQTDDVSSYVYDLQIQVPHAFKGAEFKKCLSDGFFGKAYVEIPLNIYRAKGVVELENYPKDKVSVVSFADDKFESIYVIMPKEMSKSINRLADNQPLLDRSNLKINFSILGLKSYSEIFATAIYVDGKPVQNGSITDTNIPRMSVTIPLLGIDTLLARSKDDYNFYKIIGLSN